MPRVKRPKNPKLPKPTQGRKHGEKHAKAEKAEADEAKPKGEKHVKAEKVEKRPRLRRPKRRKRKPSRLATNHLFSPGRGNFRGFFVGRFPMERDLEGTASSAVSRSTACAFCEPHRLLIISFRAANTCITDVNSSRKLLRRC
jgi:hypothetical protein